MSCFEAFASGHLQLSVAVAGRGVWGDVLRAGEYLLRLVDSVRCGAYLVRYNESGARAGR